MGIIEKINKKFSKWNKIEYTKIAQILPKGEYCFEVHTKDGKFFFKNCKQYDLYYNTFMRFLKTDDEKKED